MSAGPVPVVFGAAGPAEVVRDGVDGVHFATLDELVGTHRRVSSPTRPRRVGAGGGGAAPAPRLGPAALPVRSEARCRRRERSPS